ncbi:MAG TPA: SAM-dependent methyltransferase [Novosphingobium sp.]|nr:SAM-dependent methyltransferase [Novosphingobium sp.]
MSEGAAQRDLPARLARVIAMQGPISLTAWMGEANASYYSSRDPFGQGGDFITAPEISQMFGEMVGIWMADVWARAGRPERVLYVEPGPGRGTLARDALRVMARFGLVPVVHLVEPSPALRAVQAGAVPGAIWHDDLSSVPEDAPILLVANELLDALPVRQIVRAAAGWRERMVALAGEEGQTRFVPVAGSNPMDPAVRPQWRDAPEGTIIEICPAAAAVMGEIGGRLAAQGGAALVIDYGYGAPQTGSTLQALRNHAHADPFATPGEADLTCLVDFAAAAGAAAARGARVSGLSGQGAWLGSLGIEARAQALAKASPAHGEAVAAALHRLIAPEQMGELFKVLGLAGGDWPDGAGFAGTPPA